MSDFELIDLGAFTAFQRKVQALSNRTEDREFRLRELENPPDNFWVFEEEDEDNVFGGILHVRQGRVYAISTDVYDFVMGAFRSA